MTNNGTDRKKWRNRIMEPTLNNTGFMFKVLDDFAEGFIRFAGESGEPVLEIGCAFGNAAIPALEAGGLVTACDPEQRHLDILEAKTPVELRARLTCIRGQLPYLEMPAAEFGAILCSRVLHFLDGSAIDASVRKMYEWLKPGGRLYLVADTPYGIWRKLVPIFEAKKQRGDRWPGVMIGLENYLPFLPADRSLDGPPFMNLLDPDLLSRTCTEAGFGVETARFIDRSDFGGLGRMDGRENTGLLAHKPHC
ncbi:MAG: class I SAM-dependent methyltransferase [Gammaproteobacteria bacterium]